MNSYSDVISMIKSDLQKVIFTQTGKMVHLEDIDVRQSKLKRTQFSVNMNKIYHKYFK